MLQLTLAYVQQATREREVETELQHRQMLRSTSQTLAPDANIPVSFSQRANGPSGLRLTALS